MKRLLGATLLLSLPATAIAQEKATPYWASIASGEAMMRTGPARSYPGVWLYKRRDLPVRVLKRHESWRLVQDPDGQQGWILVTLLSDRRTALVRGSSPRPVYAQTDEGSRVRYMVEPGVVGRISECEDDWCQIQFGQREGSIRVDDLWGVAPGESVE